MQPSAIPDDEIMPGHERVIVGPPAGHDVTGQIRAVEMLRGATELAGNRATVYRARIVLDAGDIERLAAGEPFWLSLWGAVVPWDVALTEPTT